MKVTGIPVEGSTHLFLVWRKSLFSSSLETRTSIGVDTEGSSFQDTFLSHDNKRTGRWGRKGSNQALLGRPTSFTSGGTLKGLEESLCFLVFFYLFGKEFLKKRTTFSTIFLVVTFIVLVKDIGSLTWRDKKKHNCSWNPSKTGKEKEFYHLQLKVKLSRTKLVIYEGILSVHHKGFVGLISKWWPLKRNTFIKKLKVRSFVLT